VKSSGKVTPQTRTPEKAAVLDAWAAVWRETTGEAYPWGGDQGYRRALAKAHEVLAIIGDVAPPTLEKLRGVIAEFLRMPDRFGKNPDLDRTLDAFAFQARDRWTRGRVANSRSYTTGPAVSGLPDVPLDDIPY
jgi:hypothetical protein